MRYPLPYAFARSCGLLLEDERTALRVAQAVRSAFEAD